MGKISDSGYINGASGGGGESPDAELNAISALDSSSATPEVMQMPCFTGEGQAQLVALSQFMASLLGSVDAAAAQEGMDVTDALLTGLVAGTAETVTDSDSLITAIQKLQAQITAAGKTYKTVSGQYSVIGHTDSGKEVRRYYFSGTTPAQGVNITLASNIATVISNGLMYNRAVPSQWHGIETVPPNTEHTAALYIDATGNLILYGLNTTITGFSSRPYRGYVTVAMA